MAFPTLGIIDDFNVNSFGAVDASGRPGHGWGTYMISSNPFFTDGSNTYAYTFSSTSEAAQAASTTNCELYIRGENWLSGGVIQLWVRATTPIHSAIPETGYCLEVQASGSWSIFAVSGGNMGSSIIGFTPQLVGAGDWIGFEAIGSQISAYYKAAAGSWGQVATVSDSTNAGAGRMLIWTDNNGFHLDDVGGGALGTSNPLTMSVTSTTTKTFVKQIQQIPTRTVTCTPTLVKKASLTWTKTATTTTTALIQKVLLFVFSTTATGTSSFIKQVGKLCSVIGTGTPTLVKQAAKTYSVTGTGTPTFTKTMVRTFAFTVTCATLATYLGSVTVGPPYVPPFIYFANPRGDRVGQLKNT